MTRCATNISFVTVVGGDGYCLDEYNDGRDVEFEGTKGVIDIFILSPSESTEDLVPPLISEDTNNGEVFDESKGVYPQKIATTKLMILD